MSSGTKQLHQQKRKGKQVAGGGGTGKCKGKKQTAKAELEAGQIDGALEEVLASFLVATLEDAVRGFDFERHKDARRRRPLHVVTGAIQPLPPAMLTLPIPDLRQVAEGAQPSSANADGKPAHEMHTHFHLHTTATTSVPDAEADKRAHFHGKVGDLLRGMPGKLGMTAEESDHYFGPRARDNFFEQHRWVDHQRKISTENPGKTLTAFAFANNQTSSTTLASRGNSLHQGSGLEQQPGGLSGGGSVGSLGGGWRGGVAGGDEARKSLAGQLASELAFAARRPVETDGAVMAYAAAQLENYRDLADWTQEGGGVLDLEPGGSPSRAGDVDGSASPPSRKIAPLVPISGMPHPMSKSGVKKSLAVSKTLDPRIARIIRAHAVPTLDKRGYQKPVEIPVTTHDIGYVNPYRKPKENKPALLADAAAAAAGGSNFHTEEGLGTSSAADHASLPSPAPSLHHPLSSLPSSSAPLHALHFGSHSESDLGSDSLFLGGAAPVPELDDDELASVCLNNDLIREGVFDQTLPPLSPRSTYLAGCLRDRLNPRAVMMVRKTFTKSLDLRNQSLGDKMGLILAECVQRMPYLESLNLDDNRLTDCSLAPILKALVNVPGFLQLNLSNNKLDDDSSKTLAAYIGRPDCPLQALVLRHADVDDREGATFIAVLRANKTSRLRELDLSSNLLGNAEQMTALDPSIVTSGAEFGNLFSSPYCTLQKVLVGWNMIRLVSAVSMARSFRYNSSVVELDFSCNSLGVHGGLALAGSIMLNTTLRYLNIANNAIDGMACFALCAAICENKVLSRVIFDENPIGVLGSRALMQVPTVAGSRVSLSAKHCNLCIVTNPNLVTDGSTPDFDFDNIIRDYTLTLSRAYDRAVAIFLLNIVACHHTLVFSVAEYDPSPTGNGKFEPLELVQYLHADKEPWFDQNQREVKESLEELIAACTNREIAVELFNDVDTDGSGELERDEFHTLLFSIGIEVDTEKLDEVFDLYDTDQSGSIGMSEFLVFLRRQHADAIKRLEDHMHTPAYVKRGVKLVSGKVPSTTPKYVPPNVGRLHLAVVDGFARKEIYRTLTASEKTFIEAVASGTSDATSMISHGVSGSKLRVDEAHTLFLEMNNESRDKAKILAKILPQLAHPEDARLLVQKTLSGDRLELMKLRQALGASLRPLLGMCNGYYILDLSQPLDRLCLLRLMEISSTRSDELRAASRIPVAKYSADFSQKRNDNSCFRNEVFNDEPCTINAKFAQPLPKTGTLSFDFSGRKQVGADDMIATDQRVVKSLHSLFLLPASVVAASMAQLERLARLADKCRHGTGRTIYECSWQRAIDVSTSKRLFHAENLTRVEEFLGWVHEKEDVAAQFDSPEAVEAAKARSNEDVCWLVVGGKAFDVEAEPEGFEESEGTFWAVEAKLQEDLAESKRAAAALRKKRAAFAECGGQVVSEHWEPDEEAHRSGRESPELVMASRLPPKLEVVEDEFTKKYRLLLLSEAVSDEAKAARVVDAIDGVFSKQWILCRHLALICQCFAARGRKPRTLRFGSYRAEVVVLLFERLVDVQNFELVLRLLDAGEVAAVTARVGWLNFFNPLKPEGSVELNLSLYEDRVICKMLNTLATAEPGNNWPAKQFKWKFDDECMPGWELTVTWMTEAGVPDRGFVTVTYYSGEGMKRQGCRPMVNLRRALLHLTHTCREADLDRRWGAGDEAAETAGVTGEASTEAPDAASQGELPGVRYIRANELAWRTYMLA